MVLTSGVKLWRLRPQESFGDAGRSQSSSYKGPKAASVSAVRAWIAISGTLFQINAHLPCIRTLPISVSINARRFQPGVRSAERWIVSSGSQEPHGVRGKSRVASYSSQLARLAQTNFEYCTISMQISDYGIYDKARCDILFLEKLLSCP